jgi:hypothetical protein
VAWTRGAAIGLLTVTCALAWAQEQPFCRIETVEVQKANNAVIIKLTTDGLAEIEPDWGDGLFEQDEGTNDWHPKLASQFRFTMGNVRSGSASMVNVAQYPVSHVQFALDPRSRENIGISFTVYLYKPGYLAMVKRGNEDWFPDEFLDWHSDVPRLLVTTSTDQKQVTITVLTDRPEEPEPVRAAPVEASPFLLVNGSREQVSVWALHADMAALVERMAQQTGVPVFLDDQVPNKVTAHFDDAPLSQVLAGLGTAYGLCVRQDEGAYHLTLGRPDNPATYWAATTKTVALNYLEASKALLLLPDVVLPYVHANQDGNSLVINGPAPLIARIERDLATIDQPSRCCRLRAWVVSNEDSDEDVSQEVARITGGNTTWGIDGTAGDLQVGVGPGQAATVLAQLRVLARRGKVHIATLPSLVCQTGGSAEVFVGQELYYMRLAWGYYLTLDKVAVGSKLWMQLRNVGDSITASIAVDSNVAGPSSGGAPHVFQRSAQAMVCVPSGGLMAIGGLRQAEDTKQRDRPLPFLGPVGDVLSGRLRTGTRGELTLLVEAEAMASPPRRKPEEVKQP